MDQRWILRQLSEEQLAAFNKNLGPELLQEAQRFRTIKASDHASLLDAPKSMEEQEVLPSFCHQLATKAPLYAAIVIEQGNYPWETLFLQQLDSNGLVRHSLETQVPDLKPAVKALIAQEWEQSLSFESYMEHENG